MSLTSRLYQLARLSRDVEVVASGKSDKVLRRARNKLLSRLLARAGVWRRLWR